MQPNSSNACLEKITYLVGNSDLVQKVESTPALKPFDEKILAFFNEVSKALMKDSRSKAYSDVVTFAFWIRSASTAELKKKYAKEDGYVHLGRGVVFHISPSNVPVNFAYSLVSGLLSGNANIVRVPSKDFPQVAIIADAINEVLKDQSEFAAYVQLIRYERDNDVNDFLSSLCDVRVIWGGDATIAEIRKSPLPPRSTEITFADRYSLAVIDSDSYLSKPDKGAIAKDFYNDTYFTDQNACTSPRLVVWTGKKKDEAKTLFWNELYKLVSDKYSYQDIQGVDKLDIGYRLAANGFDVKLKTYGDNRLIVAQVGALSKELMDYRGNSGFFFEYDCDNILELKPVCGDKHCQTIGYIGNKDDLIPLINSGIKGVDRIVPIGKTMDFDLIWDGYDLVGQMSRRVAID